MRFGSLFTGIGGFDLGFERAGMTCAWQCEIDKHASGVLKRHWPNTRRYTDVREIGRKNLEPVDLICGGFPCQDLSVSGKRAGLAGNRSGLWWEFHRILGELLPQWVVIENVPGLLSSRQGRDLGLLLGALAQLGYGWAYRVLDAQYFGLAQRRRRVFIVGCLGANWERAAKVLFESESVSGHPAPRRETGKGVTGTLTARAGKNGAGANDEVDAGRAIPVAFQQNTRDEVRLINQDGQIARALAAQAGMKQQNYVLQETGWDSQHSHIYDARGIAPTLQTGAEVSGNVTPIIFSIQHTVIGRDKGGPEGKGWTDDGTMFTMDGRGKAHAVAFGGNNTRGEIEVSTALNAHGSGRYDFESETFIAILGHTKRNGLGVGAQTVANTLEAMTGANQAAISPAYGVRRLTPVECERLQGFPDGHTENQSDTQRYKQLGNAVAVPVAAWIGHRIMEQANV